MKLRFRTKQDLFNFGARHLLKQNARSEKLVKTRSGKMAPICAYRGQRGRSCGVGCFILDEVYRKELEGLGSGQIEVVAALKASGVPTGKLSRGLLSELQGIHDGMKPDRWLGALRALAEQVGLDLIPELRK